jgi:galactofuranosylgalactofuranosylrhamnosyl-N-acetylglucosaminyl-diphospho-decaprenol beta-1,5/1,6-galactofuranosyltransferase
LADTAAHPAPAAVEAPGAADATGFRVVHRTILRAEQEIDIRPLYVGGVSGFSASTESDLASESGDKESGKDGTNYSDAEQPSGGEAPTGIGGFGKVTTDGAVVFPEKRLTFGTYFNAFPASYWRRWSSFDSVTLRVRIRGQGTLTVYRSTARGHVQRADSVSFDGAEEQSHTFRLSLKPFIDGGWYWFDLEAGEREAVLASAEWGFETDRTRAGTFSIGITTFNRPDFCVDQLVNLSEQPDVLDLLDEVYVVDQGTQKVTDEERYPDVAAKLGAKLRLIEQGNLGGSGGFSRAMDEATTKGDSEYVLLLDDDVVCEPEGILRAIAFADLAKKTTIVGGQMFSLYDRSVMHAYGETVDRWRWFWGAAPDTKHGHNFAARSLRSTKWLHRRVDVDYNGWWMCLIPTRVVKELGLSLPMFIKWDDAEFGLRAAKAGYPTVTLPGVAVWHVPWHEKDDTIDWQAYFHRRNRIVSALLHSPYEHGGNMVFESFQTQVRHLVSMQYSPAEMGLMAIEDILEGPQRMHRDLFQRLPELRELRKGYDDARAETQIDAYPTPRRKKPPRKGKDLARPEGPVGKAKTLLRGAVKQVVPPSDLARTHPQVMVPHVDLKWWRLMQFDSALVSSADGTSVSWYKRNPKLAKDLMARSVAIHARLAREWPRLAEEYRRALPDLVSPDTWAETFENSTKRD